MATITFVPVTVACGEDTPSTPAPGGTDPPSNSDDVRSPNGTNMGAPPLNVGTQP